MTNEEKVQKLAETVGRLQFGGERYVFVCEPDADSTEACTRGLAVKVAAIGDGKTRITVYSVVIRPMGHIGQEAIDKLAR